MITKKEFKNLAIALGKRWLFPDFTNKLTWLVASIGGAILLTPTALKEIFYNWLVDTVNLNSGVHFTLAQLQSGSADYALGFGLIFLALTHNIANRCFIYKTALLSRNEEEELLKVDRELFQRFLSEFPSDSPSIVLLKEHDFGNSYHESRTKNLEAFVNTWNTAEREYFNAEMEEKRKELWAKCSSFIYKLACNSYYLGTGPMFSCIPDDYRGESVWPDHVEKIVFELNQYATDCFKLHQDLVLIGRRKLQC